MSWRRLLFAFLLLCAGIGLLLSTASRVSPVAITVGQETVVLHPPRDAPTRRRIALHEKIHRAQYRQVGVGRFVLRYIFDRRARLMWEAEASLPAICQLAQGGPVAAERGLQLAATRLQDYWVVRPISSGEAHARIREAYRGGKGCQDPLIAGELPRARDDRAAE